MPQRAALQACLGLLFLFLLVPGFFHRLLIKGRRNQVSLIWVRRFPSIRPQLAHTASTGRVTRFAGVTSLPWPQNRKQGHTRAFPFSAQSLSRPFPYGERRFFQNWAVPVFWTCPQPAHTAPTGRVTRFAGVVPLPGPQNRTQGHTRPSLGFISFSRALWLR